MIHHALSLFLHARFLAPMLSLRSFSQFDPRPPSSLPSPERRTPPCCWERSPRPCRYLLRWDIMSSDFLESSSDSKRNKPVPSSQTLQDVVRWIEKPHSHPHMSSRLLLGTTETSVISPQSGKSQSVQRLPTTLDDNKMLTECLAMVLAPDRGDYC